MKMFNFRAKVKIVGSIFFVAILLSVAVLDGTRIISDSSDNVATYIQSTNDGNYWVTNGTNLQSAIDNMADNGGTIRVGDNITLTSELKIENIGMNNAAGKYPTTIIDFQGYRVTLANDISFINLTRVKHVTVKNAVVYPTATHTASIILLNINDTVNLNSQVRFNKIENIRIRNIGSWVAGVGWTEHNATGIELRSAGCCSFLENTFRDIYMVGMQNAIYFNQTWEGWGNGNYFDNIWCDGYVYGIKFVINESSAFHWNENVFTDIKFQTAPYSKYGVYNVSGSGNHFSEILMWDWASQNDGTGKEYWIGDEAVDTVLEPHKIYIDDFLDEGADTVVRECGDYHLTEQIRNSEGHVWNASDGDNINLAVYDLYTAGGTVWVPRGTFEITASIDMYDGITVQGVGRGATIIKMTDGANIAAIFSIAADENVTIRDLTIDGNKASNTDGYGITCSSPYCTIENIAVQNTYKYGLRFLSDGHNASVSNVIIRDCNSNSLYITSDDISLYDIHIWNSTNDAIYISFAHRLNFDNIFIHNSHSKIFYIHESSYIIISQLQAYNSTSYFYVALNSHHVTIDDSIFLGGDGDGILIGYGSNNISVLGTSIEGFAGDGIEFPASGDPTKNVMISDCRLNGNTGDGVNIAGATHNNFSIHGCEIKYNGVEGIDISNGPNSNFSIRDCDIMCNGGFGISIFAAAHANYIITGNNLLGNPSNNENNGTGTNVTANNLGTWV